MTHAALKDLLPAEVLRQEVSIMEASLAPYSSPAYRESTERKISAFNAAIAALSAMEGEAAVEILGWNDNASPRLRFLTKVDRLTAGTILYTAPPPQQAELMALAAKWEADANGAGAYNVTEQEHGRILQSRRCASELRAFATHPTPSPGPQGEVVVTTDDAGRCVMVSRQDDEHRILSIIWEVSATPPAHQPGEVVDAQGLLTVLDLLRTDRNGKKWDCIQSASGSMVDVSQFLAPKEAGHDR